MVPSIKHLKIMSLVFSHTLVKFFLYFLGHMRLKLTFNAPLPVDISVLLLSEYSALMEITKEGIVKTSYTPKCKYL